MTQALPPVRLVSCFLSCCWHGPLSRRWSGTGHGGTSPGQRAAGRPGDTADHAPHGVGLCAGAGGGERRQASRRQTAVAAGAERLRGDGFGRVPGGVPERQGDPRHSDGGDPRRESVPRRDAAGGARDRDSGRTGAGRDRRGARPGGGHRCGIPWGGGDPVRGDALPQGHRAEGPSKAAHLRVQWGQSGHVAQLDRAAAS